MRLGIPANIVKDINYLSLGGKKIVNINFKLIP